MKTLSKAIGSAALVLLATLASGSAMAQHSGRGGSWGGHSGSWGGHGWHGNHTNVHFGVSLGFPIFGPAYYPAPYFGYPYGYPYAYPAYGYPAPGYAYAPAVMGASSAPAYVEQSVVQTAPAPSQALGDWYYCAASGGYYPYVRECPAGWQRVPAQPPSH